MANIYYFRPSRVANIAAKGDPKKSNTAMPKGIAVF
jgi:hypothetical protein